MPNLSKVEKAIQERSDAAKAKAKSEAVEAAAASVDPSKFITGDSSNLVTARSSKSNGLARAYYRFSLTEKRVMESLLCQLDSRVPFVPADEDSEQQLLIKLDLSAEKFAETFGLNGKNAYKQLKNAMGSLFRKIITIRKSPTDYTEYTLMLAAEYKGGEGLISVTMNPLILKHLLGLRGHFISTPMLTSINFSSTYTWRMFELLESWSQDKRKTDGKFEGWITRMPIDDLRSLLGVPKSYRWDTFESRVLKCAQSELETDVNIAMGYEAFKTGRKFTHISIDFKEVEQMTLGLGTDDLSLQLKDFQLTTD